MTLWEQQTIRDFKELCAKRPDILLELDDTKAALAIGLELLLARAKAQIVAMRAVKVLAERLKAENGRS